MQSDSSRLPKTNTKRFHSEKMHKIDMFLQRIRHECWKHMPVNCQRVWNRVTTLSLILEVVFSGKVSFYLQFSPSKSWLNRVISEWFMWNLVPHMANLSLWNLKSILKHKKSWLLILKSYSNLSLCPFLIFARKGFPFFRWHNRKTGLNSTCLLATPFERNSNCFHCQTYNLSWSMPFHVDIFHSRNRILFDFNSIYMVGLEASREALVQRSPVLTKSVIRA